MKRDESSIIVLSKPLVIGIVILITLASFSTGYLIGRYSRESSTQKETLTQGSVPKSGSDVISQTAPEIEKDTSQESQTKVNNEFENKNDKGLKKQDQNKEKTPLMEEEKFYLQVGAFRDHQRALRLKSMIKNSFNNVIILREGQVSKVLVGGYSDKKEAMIAATRVKNLYKLDSIIINKKGD